MIAKPQTGMCSTSDTLVRRVLPLRNNDVRRVPVIAKPQTGMHSTRDTLVRRVLPLRNKDVRRLIGGFSEALHWFSLSNHLT